MPYPPSNRAEFIPLLSPASAPGELGRLGGYPIVDWLGAGGMGFVCKARDLALDRVVALKVMKPDLAADVRCCQRFEREARLLAAVTQHDHVVVIHAVGQVRVRHRGADQEVPCLEMEYLKGETLYDRLRRERSLPPDEVIRIGRQAATGLAAIHAAGLVHRDVKPGNLWLEEGTGRVKVLDLGLARSADDTHFTLPEHQPSGTLPYMAPEQLARSEVDARADLFALGCVLYESATGRRAFASADRSTPPQAPHKVNPSVSQRLSALILKLLVIDPNERHRSAAELLHALDQLNSPEEVIVNTPQTVLGSVGATTRPDAGLRGYLKDKLTLGDVGEVWHDTLGEAMSEQMPGKSLGDCIIELLNRTDRRGLRQQLHEVLVQVRPDLDLARFFRQTR